MSEINKRIDAFPHEAGILQTGMTLRDYFAAKAITVLLDHTTTNTRVAEEAYKVADAMLEARK